MDATPTLKIRGLDLALPGGHALLTGLSLELAAGEVVALLGGSGSGKSTLANVLIDRDELERAGFSVSAELLEFDRGALGLVPQRGALFDHLTVGGNIALAADHRRGDGDPVSPATWLERVGLPAELEHAPTSVLSGGQAQRVAVARTLAANRRLVILDEPSVGLDPFRVRELAELIRREVEDSRASALVVTHDVAFAADVADRLLLLDPNSRSLRPLLETEPGPQLNASATDRLAAIADIESGLLDALAQPATATAAHGSRSPFRARLRAAMRPFLAAGRSLVSAPRQIALRPRHAAHILRRVFGQALLRPLPFYAVVSCLIGYTVLYVVSQIGGAGVRPDALIRQIGGSYAVALGPALSAILFTAASGSATNAWLGSIELTKQGAALKALGVDVESYLWSQSFVAVAVSYLISAATFCIGLLLGGTLVCWQLGLDGGFELLSADFLDPRPERVRYAMRAGFLMWIYAWGIAANVVAKGTAPKPDADSVTRAMTSSVVSCTLWIVCWELLSVLVALRT